MHQKEESGSHQPTIRLHQGNDNLHQMESGGLQHSQLEVNLQQRGDREKNGQTMHTNRSQSRGKSHVSHVENEKDMQREIDELKKKLRRARRRRASLNLNLLLGIQRMSRIGKDPKLRPVKPSPVMRSIVVIGVTAKVHRTRV